MNGFWKIIIGVLLGAAVLLGLLQRSRDPYVNEPIGYMGVTDGQLKDYYQKARQLKQDSLPQKTAVNFLAVGDIMLSRKVAKAMDNNNDWLLPYSKTEELLNNSDFVFGNLESPFNGSEYYNPGETLIFNAPLKTIEGLKLNNFQVLQLANNHALDQGIKGLRYTENLLDEFNIQHIGTGSTTTEAFKPAIIEKNGIKICFIGASYASVNDGGKAHNTFVARIEEIENLKLEIENSKSYCDFVVVSMHAGTEYTYKPNKAQINFAHAAIDFGADMVIGHHPHWIQTIERYCPNTLTLSASPLVGEGVPTKGGTDEGTNKQCTNPKYIFYSLGNFIFDQMWSKETTEGLTLKITISKNACHPENLSSSESYPGSSASNLDSDFRQRRTGMAGMTCGNNLQGPKTPATLDQIELIPIIIENYSTPRPATEQETKNILNKIGEKNNILK